MKRKNRIVVEVQAYQQYNHFLGKEITSYHWVEVYSSSYLVDCKKWIKEQYLKNPCVVYRIYVEEE